MGSRLRRGGDNGLHNTGSARHSLAGGRHGHIVGRALQVRAGAMHTFVWIIRKFCYRCRLVAKAKAPRISRGHANEGRRYLVLKVWNGAARAFTACGS